MKPVEVRQRIESETLTLPELRQFIGRDVRITVVDEAAEIQQASDEFWNPPSLEELIVRKGIKPATETSLFGTLTAEDFEGFDEFMEAIKEEGRNRAERDDLA